MTIDKTKRKTQHNNLTTTKTTMMMDNDKSMQSTDKDPMGSLNAYFDTVSLAKKEWAAMKEQISILVAANHEMEVEYQATKKENRSMKKEYQSMKEENRNTKKEIRELKTQKHSSDKYAKVLEKKVQTLSLDNQVMRVQIDTQQKMIAQAHSELGQNNDMFCGATSMIAH
jgi:chromosome segregation ATPase